ncbi:MAG: cell envelope integrity protein CreD [Phaeodactylibacter sp.]|nr:cell envelope integrity protein CreD [Phaeodactylibacter sp.]
MANPSFFDRLNNWARNSVTLKLLTVGFLVLILLIPASMVNSLIQERENIRDNAVQEVSAKWGGPQTIAGPVISVPYERALTNAEGKLVTERGYAHFLPDTIDMAGSVLPEKRYRGIYVVVLYNTKLKVQGHFSDFRSDALSVPEESLQWEEAIFTIGISDMKGVEAAIPVRLNDTIFQLGPGTVTKDLYQSGASTPLTLNGKRESTLDFAFELDLNGSTDLHFTPFGKTTTVQLSSQWAAPSFEGAFLPDERMVSDSGFTAHWQVLQLNRNYPQQGVGSFMQASNQNNAYYRADPVRRNASSFGLKLLLPIDEYQKTMRSAKYAIYFILFTFLTLFFIEILNRKRLHPLQYLLVGAGIVLFYVLLLSFSEHLSFNASYWIACAAILVLITGYSSFILRNRKLTVMVFGILIVLYGFFYSILQLQDYALLMGSLGLLLILGVIMYLTRNVDWYQLKREE